jgi:hypothetical protein
MSGEHVLIPPVRADMLRRWQQVAHTANLAADGATRATSAREGVGLNVFMQRGIGPMAFR